MTGAVALITKGDAGALRRLGWSTGELWMLPVVICAAAQVLLLKRTPAGVTQGPLLTASVLVVLVSMLPFLALQPRLQAPVDAGALAAIAYIGVMASALAFWLWNRSVAAVGPTRASSYLYLMPLYGAVMSHLALGGPLQGYQAVGGGLVLVGLWMARSPPARSGSSARR
ncbi:DMT family transporter [Variovorax saccharolyticus]|uniref:DMT family transporter n=1 Tax=Variovorax saccharolyticus TaxID=3053516 RepID=UPI002575D690|nr:DMT family transporter [Variovorax sp. J31P216]MDM0029622.1 DMT family transporter [Variovorax sp. J31P216]